MENNDRFEQPVVTVERSVPTPTAGLVVRELQKLRHDLVAEIRQLGEQRGEQPGFFNIWPQGHLTTQRVRANKLVIACLVAAGITLDLRVGGSRMLRLRVVEGTTEWDFPYIVQSGQTVELIDVATGAAPLDTDVADAWITGFTE